MSAELTAEETRGPGIVLQPEEGQSYWQPIWANGYSIVKLSPKHAGPDNLAMGIQIIAPGGYVREHSHTPNQEILFCFAGKGTIIVDGVPHPFVPGTTVYAAPGVRHKIINDGPDELKMTWTYLPPGLDDFFAAIGRPRDPREPAPEPFARPDDVHAIEARTGYQRRSRGELRPRRLLKGHPRRPGRRRRAKPCGPRRHYEPPRATAAKATCRTGRCAAGIGSGPGWSFIDVSGTQPGHRFRLGRCK